MKKLLVSLLTLTLFLPSLALADSANVSQDPSEDACGEEFIYVKDSAMESFSTSPETVDDRVLIRFEGGGVNLPDRMVDISNESYFEENGYSVTKVELDVENDDHDGYFEYATSSLNNFDPEPGDRILSIRVTVKKTCPDVCPNIDGEQYVVPDGYELDGGQCVIPPPPPVDLCANIDDVQETIPEGYEATGDQCTVIPPPPAPEPTPEPPRRRSGGGGSSSRPVVSPTVVVTREEQITVIKKQLIVLIQQFIILLQAQIDAAE